MNLLLARFSLFLIMMIGIAGSTLVQGNAPTAKVETAACVSEVASMSTVSLAAREKSGSSTPRPVRWQALLPGAFR